MTTHRPIRRRLAVLTAALALLGITGGCSSGDGATSEGGDGDRPSIVVTTSILADVTGNVVGDAAEVETLVPAGADPHSFEPSAAQVARLHEADLIVANGLGLEASLDGFLDSAVESGTPLLEVAPELGPIPFGSPTQASEHDHGGPDEHHGGSDGHGDDGHDHGAGDLDPHVWTDPDRMATAARLIGEAVAEHTGVDAAVLEANAAAYDAELRLLDEEIQATLAVIPPEERILVTNHGSLGYFAERYGFEVVGTLTPGGSTLGEPSAASLARLADTIRDSGVPAIFTEVGADDSVARSLAAEVGTGVEVVALHTDALGPPGSGAETYVAMMSTNARLLAEALAP